jgi:hypothetical protein
MGVFVLDDARVEVNGVNLSEWVKTVKLNYGAAIQETTAMTKKSFTGIAGLKDWDIDLELNQDFAAGAVDATLWPLIGAAQFPVKVRPTSGAISATNPEFQGNALLETYPPLSGGRGEVAGVSIKIRGTGDLLRATG